MRTQKKGVVVSKTRAFGGVFSSTRRDSLCWLWWRQTCVVCVCVCVCVVVSASSFEAFTTRFGETKEESLSSFSDTLN